MSFKKENFSSLNKPRLNTGFEEFGKSMSETPHNLSMKDKLLWQVFEYSDFFWYQPLEKTNLKICLE